MPGLVRNIFDAASPNVRASLLGLYGVLLAFNVAAWCWGTRAAPAGAM